MFGRFLATLLGVFTCAAHAGLISPPPGTSLSDSTVTFIWDASEGPAVVERYLMVGTTLGGSDIYAGYQGSGLARWIPGLPLAAPAIFVRLMSYVDGAWQVRDYSYRTPELLPSEIFAPTPGTTIFDPTVTFQWSPESGVSQRYLLVSDFRGNVIYGGYQGTALSRTVRGIPMGSEIHVTLSSEVGGIWKWAFYTYSTTTPSPTYPMWSKLVSPAPNSWLCCGSATFTWDAGIGVTERYLVVGSAPGLSDVYAGYQGAALSRTVTGITVQGSIYVTVFSWMGDRWHPSSSYEYVSGGDAHPPPTPPIPSFITGPPSSLILENFTTFSWTAGNGVQERYLAVGIEALGGYTEIYAGYQGAALSRTVLGIPCGSMPIRVSLMSFIEGAWVIDDSVYRSRACASA